MPIVSTASIQVGLIIIIIRNHPQHHFNTLPHTTTHCHTLHPDCWKSIPQLLIPTKQVPTNPLPPSRSIPSATLPSSPHPRSLTIHAHSVIHTHSHIHIYVYVYMWHTHPLVPPPLLSRAPLYRFLSPVWWVRDDVYTPKTDWVPLDSENV